MSILILLLSCSTEPEVVHGCLDSTACNYNSSATIDNNSCAELDCEGVCGGLSYEDDCGICDSNTTNDCPIQPIYDFDYAIALTPASENETYYADGCHDCTDYNPITFIAALSSDNETVSNKTINFSYAGIGINHSTSPFNFDAPTTLNNGMAQVTYDDRGFDGDVTIEASFTASFGIFDSTITATYNINLQPYYLKVNEVSMYVTITELTAGDINSNTTISFFVTDENNIGLPNLPVLFSKNSTIGTFYSNTNAPNAEQTRTDIVGIASVNFTISDASVTDESIIISAVVDDSNIEDPANFTSNIEITIGQIVSP